MALSNDSRKHLRAIGHQLKPVVTVAEKGLSDGVMQEISRALDDHELIKVKIALTEREERQKIILNLTDQSQAELVQVIGKIALIYRKAKNPKPHLSNLRAQK